ncbi:MAG: D-glycero-beta-D-manno-heptose-7-phosphate kinase [Acidobacteriia bacterium]|nr:D-glycero-beta-D-manno-heptose-7-phosphate kinase [Terriglobia bacterium]
MPLPTADPHLFELIGRFPQQRILVAGDLMLDEFIWGRVSRISPEAPVPVVNVTGESYYPGGAANVARNVREFTAQTAVMGFAGLDRSGQCLLELLRRADIETQGVIQDPSAVTTVKTRVIARNQQVVRVDRERIQPLTTAQLAAVREYLETALCSFDAIVVADYGKGFFSQALADEICRLARLHKKVLTVDPHPHTSLVWRGATAIKPNRIETFSASGNMPAEPVEPVSEDRALFEAARRLQQRWESPTLLVTLGEQGMLLFEGDTEPLHLPARAREVFDVSGAGDTAIAVFTLSLTAGATPIQAAELANLASSIAVAKVGTATVTPAELMAASDGV